MIPEQWLQHAPKPQPLTGTNEWHVFLSYRSVNRIWVLNLYDVLTQLGFKVFIDQCALAAGDLLLSRLGKALGSSQAGILIWSNAAADSVWVEQEYLRLEHKATTNPAFEFVPVKLDGAELPEFAQNRISVDFSSYPDGPNGGELLRLLYGIVGMPLSQATAEFAARQDVAAKEAMADIKASILNNDPEEIAALFNTGGVQWKTTPALGCKAIESLVSMKKPAEAILLAEKMEELFPIAIRPKQLHALALARRGEEGDLKKAQKILGRLYAKGERDPETLGIYARTWMDRYNASGDLNDLLQSRDYYAEAFERAPDDYYTGINAAAKSVFAGEQEKAEAYAAVVQQLVGETQVPDDYWKTATVAEVFLMRKRYVQAGDMYAQAVKMARNNTGDHESSRKQAIRLMEKMGTGAPDREVVLKAFGHLPLFTT